MRAGRAKMFETIAFYFFSATAIIFFAISVISKNVLNAMTSLAAAMIFVSGLFFLLNADFLGVVQIIIYTGAVMVLYAFAMIFFDANKEIKEQKNSAAWILSISIAILLIFITLSVTTKTNLQIRYPVVENLDNIKYIGILIFTHYLVVFELVAIMLLVAMIGGIVLVHRQMDNSITTKEER